MRGEAPHLGRHAASDGETWNANQREAEEFFSCKDESKLFNRTNSLFFWESPSGLTYLRENRIRKIPSSAGAKSSEYAAPIGGVGFVLGLWFYKDVAPAALRKLSDKIQSRGFQGDGGRFSLVSPQKAS